MSGWETPKACGVEKRPSLSTQPSTRHYITSAYRVGTLRCERKHTFLRDCLGRTFRRKQIEIPTAVWKAPLLEQIRKSKIENRNSPGNITFQSSHVKSLSCDPRF